MQLRAHQAELSAIVDSIIAGEPIRKIIVHATPGSGKSLLPMIMGRLIQEGLCDALAWVVPRLALQDQGERDCLDPFFRKMIGHNLSIRSSTNEVFPCRDQRGFCSTYQALAVDERQTVLQDFRRRRYILVLDEIHHLCADDGQWMKFIAPLVDLAAFNLFMTGTLERGDDKRIAFIDYVNDMPSIINSKNVRAIRYTRTDALKEKTILPVRFKVSDGYVEWEDKRGQRKSGRLSHKVGDSNEALFTALSTEFADSLLREGVDHWLSWKAKHPRSKCLVVTANIDHAKRFLDALLEMGIRAKIATSHDSPEAMKNIKEFKRDLDCLVTIAMAYEGLDVPPITHIISLTHVRSIPWIEQMVGRAIRIDPLAGPYSSQMAYVFAPDDFLFRQVVESIRREQLPIAEEAERQKAKKGGDGEGEAPPGITPLNGELTDTREIHLGESQGGASETPILTITEQEEERRKEIESHVRSFSFLNRYRIEKINAEIKAYFGKSRTEMSLKELERCFRFIKSAYPMDSKKGHPGLSRPRGAQKRVPTKAEPWSGGWGE